MIDPTIWKERARLTIDAAVARAIDHGARIDDIESIVRASTPHPFGSARPRGPEMKEWFRALDARFASARKRGRRRPPPE